MMVEGQPHITYAAMHQACAALGTRLFTITVLDEAAGLARRAYTSHPAEYPVQGTKPLTRDGWHDHCIVGRQTFVANTVPEFARYFFDHALITSLGLGSCINMPVFAGTGPVLGTVNLLAEEHHFTPARLAAYHVLAARHHAALVAAMADC
jgi:GAF domain